MVEQPEQPEQKVKDPLSSFPKKDSILTIGERIFRVTYSDLFRQVLYLKEVTHEFKEGKISNA